jgi:hypothetical protein
MLPRPVVAETKAAINGSLEATISTLLTGG